MAHSMYIVTDFIVRFHSVQWPIAFNQIHRSGSSRVTKFAAVAQSA
jgi:hypothetical protein